MNSFVKKQSTLAFKSTFESSSATKSSTSAPAETVQETPVAPKEEFQASSQSKPKLIERFRGLIGSMFDE